MSASALTFMLISFAVILVATGHCFYKLLTSDRRFGE